MYVESGLFRMDDVSDHEEANEKTEVSAPLAISAPPFEMEERAPECFFPLHAREIVLLEESECSQYLLRRLTAFRIGSSAVSGKLLSRIQRCTRLAGFGQTEFKALKRALLAHTLPKSLIEQSILPESRLPFECVSAKGTGRDCIRACRNYVREFDSLVGDIRKSDSLATARLSTDDLKELSKLFNHALKYIFHCYGRS